MSSENPAPPQFRDASEVSRLMKTMHDQFKDGKEIAGMAVVAQLAGAMATLADEIEELKSMKS